MDDAAANKAVTEREVPDNAANAAMA